MREVEARGGRNDELLLRRVCICARFLRRLRGLMFRRRLDDGEGLLLVGQRESRLGAKVHMFFVFFPITVVWLDGEGRVMDMRLACPFRPFYVPQAPAKDVLEGPPSLMRSVHVGDRLHFSEGSA